MSDFPVQRSNDQGVPFAPVASSLPAGLRSLLADHPRFPFSRVLPALAVRLAVAALCFAGGYLCAWLSFQGLGDAPTASAIATLVVASVLVCAIAHLALAKAGSRRPRVPRARAVPGLRQQIAAYLMDVNHG